MLRIENIKAEMARNNMTGLTLAKKLDIHPATLYHKLNGKRQFTAAELGKIAVMFKVEVNFFYQ